MYGISRLIIILLVAVEPQAFIPAYSLGCLNIHLRQFCFEYQRQVGCILKLFNSRGSNATPSASRRDPNVLNKSEFFKPPQSKHSNHGSVLAKKGRKRITRVQLSVQMCGQGASPVDREAFFVNNPSLLKVIFEFLLHH